MKQKKNKTKPLWIFPVLSLCIFLKKMEGEDDHQTYQGTDSTFRQKFWRQAFIYARILEKDEFNTEEIEKYKEMRTEIMAWLDRQRMIEREFHEVLKRQQRERFEFYAVFLVIWPFFLCLIVFLLEITFIKIELLPKLPFLSEQAVLAQEFCTWVENQSVLLRVFFIPYYVQGRFFIALMAGVK